MRRKILLYITISIILIYGFIISPDFTDVAAGVAIFLFGMIFLQQGFKSFTGGTFENLLHKSTDKMWKSMAFGFVASSLVQSSSLVSIITISFLSAELITLIQGIGITLGANIGTTTGIWLIAGYGLKMNISAIGMPLLVLGIICNFQKDKIIKGIGNVFAGLGFVFLGIAYMKMGFEAFSSTIDLSRYAIPGMLGVVIFTLIGLLATIVMQSSHATIILVLTALVTGQIAYENALALVIGANIGTNFTSFIVSLTGNKDSKRVGLNDLILKLVAAFIFITFFYQIVPTVDFLAQMIGIGTENYALKVALFHTLYNVIGVALMLIFINQMVFILKKVFPDKKTDVYGAIYLSRGTIELPDIAIISLIKESRHLYYNALEVILESIGLKQSDIVGEINREAIKEKINPIGEEETETLYNERVKNLYGEIIEYSILAQTTNETEYHEDFSKVKIATSLIAESVKIVINMQSKLAKYLKSTNSEIKEQYENIIKELIDLLVDINRLREEKNDNKSLDIYFGIEKSIEDKNIISNGTIDKLIREQKISNEMATSLINDSNDKIEMFGDLARVAEIIFHNNVSDKKADLNKKEGAHWLEDNLSGKKLEKVIEKLQRRLKKLQKELKETKKKDVEKKEKLQREIESVEFLLGKYGKNRKK